MNDSSINSSGNVNVTADLTHNNQGGDTSSSGHIPDNIPINFFTNIGSVTNTGYTRNGKTTVNLNLNGVQSCTVNNSATLDNQTALTSLNIPTSSTLPITTITINGTEWIFTPFNLNLSQNISVSVLILQLLFCNSSSST